MCKPEKEGKNQRKRVRARESVCKPEKRVRSREGGMSQRKRVRAKERG